MDAQRELWMRILVSVVLSVVGLLVLSWYLDREETQQAEVARPLPEVSLPALKYLESRPGAYSGLPLRDLSLVERLELVQVPEGADIASLACVVDLRSDGLFLRKPEQVPSRIYLRSQPLDDLAPMQRAWLLRALEELLEDWDRDPSELELPPGQAFRTLTLWMRRDPIPWARH